jgi:hypothetical protein
MKKLEFMGDTLKVEITLWKEGLNWTYAQTVYIRGTTELAWNGRGGGETPQVQRPTHPH